MKNILLKSVLIVLALGAIALAATLPVAPSGVLVNHFVYIDANHYARDGNDANTQNILGVCTQAPTVSATDSNTIAPNYTDGNLAFTKTVTVAMAGQSALIQMESSNAATVGAFVKCGLNGCGLLFTPNKLFPHDPNVSVLGASGIITSAGYPGVNDNDANFATIRVLQP